MALSAYLLPAIARRLWRPTFQQVRSPEEVIYAPELSLTRVSQGNNAHPLPTIARCQNFRQVRPQEEGIQAPELSLAMGQL